MSFNSNNKNNINISGNNNEFIHTNLYDPINYNINFRSMNKIANLPERFVDKPRIIKEVNSISSFKMNNLKKHINPSEIFDKNLYQSDPYLLSSYSMYENNNNNNLTNTNFSNNNNNNINLYQTTLLQQNNLIFNGMNPINNNNNNNNNNLYAYAQNYINNENNIENTLNNLDPNQPVTTNLLAIIETKMKNLKEETDFELNKLKNAQNKNIIIEEENNDEKNNINNEKKYENGFQMMADYSNKLEQIQKEREENSKRLKELEKKYKESKKQEEKNLKENENLNNNNNNNNPFNNNNNIVNSDILNELKNIFNLEQSINKFKKLKKPSNNNKKPSFNKEEKINDLSSKESKFIKNFAKFQIKKRMDDYNNNNNNINNISNNDWNNTRILSKNINGNIQRNDDLPGYFGYNDLSLYYYDIKDPDKEDKGKWKAPHIIVNNKEKLNNSLNLSLKYENMFFEKIGKKKIGHGNPGVIKNVYKNRLHSADKIKINNNNYYNNNNKDDENINLKIVQKENKNFDNKNNKNDNNKNNNNNIKNNIIIDPNEPQFESFNSFLDDIFLKLDTKKIGYITKNSISNYKIPKQILNALNFQSNEDFNKKLENFPTNLYNHLNKEEFSKFCTENPNSNINLIKKIDNQQILLEKEKKEKKDNEEINEEKFFIEEDDDYLPVYNTKDIILSSNSNIKRLQLLRKAIENENKKKRPKSSNINSKFDNNNNFDYFNSKKNKKPTYGDYKEIINKYNTKSKINFTIPKPFSFNKNSNIKNLEKLNIILQERQNNENKKLTNFKANNYNSEIFIGNVDALILNEKKIRQNRIEKLNKKIQSEMKPFSFVEKDEIKQKEKQKKIKEYENTKEFFPQFKSNTNIKFTIHSEKEIRKKEKERLEKIKKQSLIIKNKSKLPPRLEQHEKEKKIKEEVQKEEKLKEKNKTKKIDHNIYLPDYKNLQKKFYDKVKTDKENAKKTKIEPFKFHKIKKIM